MPLDAWYNVIKPRAEVRQGRSFNPDEFAIALEQVAAGTAPPDYVNPAEFFRRTCFTVALREHASMVLRRLSGETTNTAPVMALITQFGGGKTHTLTALYHLAKTGAAAADLDGVGGLLVEAGISQVPQARVAVFVGNAWDPQPGRETPWIDLAVQIAGEAGVAALGPTAHSIPPGTEAISRVLAAANAPVLVLCDEVLNFVNRHRELAEPFHAFLQNLTVALTGSSSSAAVISLPRSQVEMTEWDLQWQERLSKIIRRVAKDLLVNEEAEIGEVIRRRLFDDLEPDKDKARRKVARVYAQWCVDHQGQLPSEWISGTSTTKASDRLAQRFEAAYPFHPATLSVFQRKWQVLPQYQQTRGTLAMLAQWIAAAYKTGYKEARNEPLITLGSAPLHNREFISVVLGQLGEPRLEPAIRTDIAGDDAHARVLDLDTKGSLKDIHRRVGTVILFESTGGQQHKEAHLPELRFALGEPEIDTTSIDTAALALESKAFFIRKIGSDGFQIKHQPTLKQVAVARRASLDVETEVGPAIRDLVKRQFEVDRSMSLFRYPVSGVDVPDAPQLTLIVMDPSMAWTGDATQKAQLLDWTRNRGESARLYPGALVWCFNKPGRELQEAVELQLAWDKVGQDMRAGTLGKDFTPTELREPELRAKEAKDRGIEAVWAGYRYVILWERDLDAGLRVIDLGAGHASSGETLVTRILRALKNEALLNATISSSYIDRNWPLAFQASGAWPLASLRQCLLDGSLTRLIDPEQTLRQQIPEWVSQGEFGLGISKAEGGVHKVWYQESVSQAELSFAGDVYLIRRATAMQLKTSNGAEPAGVAEAPTVVPTPPVNASPEGGASEGPSESPSEAPDLTKKSIVRIHGTIPPESWNRIGTQLIPRLRGAQQVSVHLSLEAELSENQRVSILEELHRTIYELGQSESLTIDVDQRSDE